MHVVIPGRVMGALATVVAGLAAGTIGSRRLRMADDRAARTLRLPPETAEQVEMVARIDQMSGNDLITVAVQQYLATRGNNKQFSDRLSRLHKSERDAYERLVK